MTPHISALKSDIAPLVIMPGDPIRTKYIAHKYLTNIELVNETRLALAYTGFYNGKRVTIFSSGMGMPSMAIYATELFKYYDVEKIIRVGSCGSYYEEIKVNDIILAEKAYTLSNFAYQYYGISEQLVESSKSMNNKILDVAYKEHKRVKIGNINTSDLFYHEATAKEIKENYCLAVEMECFALFYLAKQFKKEATAILTVSDNLVTKEELSSKEREETFDNAITLALESI